MEPKIRIIRCPWCNMPSQVIWVHGHGQCSTCGINIDECCRGENCNIVIKTDKDENGKTG